MLTRALLNKAINDKIKGEFPGIELQSTDVEEGFDRPSFFVLLETNRTETYQFSQLREMTCRIRFFPTDKHEYKEETYDIQDRLEKLFGLNFTAGDRVITIEDASTGIVDKVLQYDFNFSYHESIAQPETGELMQELVYNG